MALEEEFRFEIPDNEADKINAINLAVDFIASHPQAKQTKAIHAFTQVPPISMIKLDTVRCLLFVSLYFVGGFPFVILILIEENDTWLSQLQAA